MALLKAASLALVVLSRRTNGATWSTRASNFGKIESVTMDSEQPRETAFDDQREAVHGSMMIQLAAKRVMKAGAIGKVKDDIISDIAEEFDSETCSIGKGSVVAGGPSQKTIRVRPYWSTLCIDVSVLVVVFISLIWFQCRSLRVPETLSVRFRPGSLGLCLDPATGVVTGVKEDSQAKQNGVKANMAVAKVNDIMYSKKLLDECLAGQEDFLVIFTIS